MSKIKQLNSQAIADVGKVTDQTINPDSFCILPFSHLSTTTTGEIRLCCRSKAIDHIKKSSLLSVWQSEKMNSIRQDLISGKKIPECEKCWVAEDKGITSLREGQNVARIKTYKKQVQDFFEKKKLVIPSLELKLSNRCNLKCKMCSPAASHRWTKQWNDLEVFFDDGYRHWIAKISKENGLDQNTFLDVYSKNPSFQSEISEMAPHINLLDFAGGEPLIDPLHYQFLNDIIQYGQPHETTLRYSTNLTVLAFEHFSVLDIWNQFKKVELTVSIDGHYKLNDYIRNGSQHEKIKKNIEIVKKLAPVQSIKCTTTLSAYNAPFMSEIATYVLGELDCTWHTSRVTSPDFLDARVWPLQEKKTFIEKARSFSPEVFTTEPRRLTQALRHMNDYISWLETDFSDVRLFDKFVHYTQILDKKSDQNYIDFFELPGQRHLSSFFSHHREANL